jgi:SHS2 domain-containing protein
MDKKYEILEHKADLKIKAFGRTKEELFLNMLKAMSDSQNPEFLEKEIKRQIEIKALDLPALLVDFLNEALYLSQANDESYFNVSFKDFSDNEIKADLIGKKIRRFGEDIKAVTYHDVSVKQKNDAWEAIILFDI